MVHFHEGCRTQQVSAAPPDSTLRNGPLLNCLSELSFSLGRKSLEQLRHIFQWKKSTHVNPTTTTNERRVGERRYGKFMDGERRNDERTDGERRDGGRRVGVRRGGERGDEHV